MQQIRPHRLHRKKSRSPQKIVSLLIILSVVVTELFLFNYYIWSRPKHPDEIMAQPQVLNAQIVASDIPPPSASSAPVATQSPSPQISHDLEKVVQDSLEGTKGKYAVVITNFKTGESYLFNENERFDAGSLYKLWVMGRVFELLKDGKLEEDQVLSQSVEELNRKFSIDPEYAERKEGTVKYSVKDALTQMITISHNYAALLLTEKIRLSSVTEYLKTINLTQSKVGTSTALPYTTASDTALYLEKLYKNELSNKEYSDQMLDLLKKQKLNNKLPKYLPKGTIMAHKTGELGQVSHDAGIVFSDKGDYIIVVLSKSTSPKGAEDRIALLSKAVYEYFNRK